MIDDNDIKSRVSVLEANTKNICGKLDTVLSNTNDIYRKLDEFEKNMYEGFSKQKDSCIVNHKECENHFVTKEINKNAWGITTFFAVIICGIISFYGIRLYERVDNNHLTSSNNSVKIEKIEEKIQNCLDEMKPYRGKMVDPSTGNTLWVKEKDIAKTKDFENFVDKDN